MERRIAVRGIIIKDGKLLCMRLKPHKFDMALPQGTYCTPGGGLDEDESIEDCLVRELEEEIGVRAKVGDLLYVQQYRYIDREYVEFFFHCTNPDDFLSIDLSKTTHGEKEVAEVAFVDPREVKILPEFLANEDYSQVKQSGNITKIFNYL